MAEARPPRVAYLCMEYGLDERLPLYAGGLGILAGDLLKAAHDVGFPMVGVGILWRQGYVEQQIDAGGRVVDAYPRHDAIKEYLEEAGVEVTVAIRGRPVRVKVWRLPEDQPAGSPPHAPLLLLDTNVPANADRWITGQLYGWFAEERVAQEMVLGIGGVRALQALGLEPEIYHFNEGHAVLAGIELIRQGMETGMTFEQAWQAARRRIVFTTHTPVKEGNEEHPLALLEYMGAFNGLNRRQMIRIGGDPFHMTVAALRLSRAANGVSELHGRTARQMWADVTGAPPIQAITNGVHVPTWQDPRIARAYAAGDDLWPVHQALKRELLAWVKCRTGVQLAEDHLLLGFTRRAAPYKRATLIFQEPERIGPYLESGRIQILFSGKAHPLDDRGKEIVETLVGMARRFPKSVVFVPDYDMEVARMVTRGADVWLNNPRRPLEACGTSGMKAAINGVLNFSVLDGWWPEAFREGENGWQIGDGYEGPGADAHDAGSLYETLLGDILPAYEQDRSRWTQMMRQSIADVMERFSAERVLDRYDQEMYGAARG
ncbi:alpha-glucan family phosphorylase [Carboxydochorda subterranea]|uniref:Alpha-glucan family phosphorylase n=1 Tax=Carboxydichorda subterranea TaxID=3109565 RepID=A0ABZ1BTK6_9FIRM|nr:alpha-glucan family phosphorylase [Limnochorda sp. L945t]WRP16150.1 alpha-glucan family phosphorylase [Limnochorda sp. L945t]